MLSLFSEGREDRMAVTEAGDIIPCHRAVTRALGFSCQQLEAVVRLDTFQPV
jgi:hypothetical protein